MKFHLKDRVAYSHKFMKSLAIYDKSTADKRGDVVATTDPFVTVKWDDEEKPQRVHENNLCRESATGVLVDECDRLLKAYK